MAKLEKKGLYKTILNPYNYFRYLEVIFIIWPHGEKAFYGFFDLFNKQEKTQIFYEA